MSYRPNLQGRTEDILEQFISRGIYRTKGEAITAALELLLERRMEDESREESEEIPASVVDLQLAAQGD